MIFIETSVFTQQVADYLTDDEYSQLQYMLIGYPEFGKVIPGSGGLRKIRWGTGDRGKRGGLRVIYYWVTEKDQILMLFLYPKNKMSDLSPEHLRRLKQVVEESIHGR